MKKRTVITALIALLFCSGAIAQHLDNKGTEFMMTFLPNYSGESAVELHLTADDSTDVTIHYPLNDPSFSTTVPVIPGQITIVSLPTDAANSWAYGTIQDNAVHAYADKEFVCYMINRLVYTSDAALALPVDVMNTDYIVMNYDGGTPEDNGEFAVVAIYDATLVTITPKNGLYGGYEAGVPFTARIMKNKKERQIA